MGLAQYAAAVASDDSDTTSTRVDTSGGAPGLTLRREFHLPDEEPNVVAIVAST